MFLPTNSYASGDETTFTASISRSVTASEDTAGKRNNKTSMHQKRKWSRTTRVIENVEDDETPDLREAEEGDESAWVDCDSDEDNNETTRKIMQPRSLVTKKAGSGFYLPRFSPTKVSSSSFGFKVPAVKGLKVPSFTSPGTPSLFRDDSMASSSAISPSSSSSTVPSSHMYLSSSHTEQWSRIEHNTESLSSSSLVAAAKVKELSELFKRFDLLFTCVIRRQAKQDTFLKHCVAGIEGLDSRTVDLAQALEDLNKNVAKHIYTISEIKNTITALNTTIETLVPKIKKVDELSPDTSKAISMLRVDIINMSENIITGTLVGFQAAIAYCLQFAASPFHVLDMHREINPRNCHDIQRSTGVGSGFDFEDQDDPLTQILFPQGNGRFEKSIIRVIEVTLPNRKCFEEGFVKAGRGGGGGGGWCAVM